MSQKDTISFQLKPEDELEIKNAISVLQEKLLPHLKSLTPSEKSELAKMGDKTLAFVLKSMEYIEQNSEFVPSFLNKEALKIDIKAIDTLHQLIYPINQIHDRLIDSLLLSGSEAYMGSLMFYDTVKSAAKNNVPIQAVAF